jgi:hypothetical protein
MRYHYNALSPKCMHKNNIFSRLILVRLSSLVSLSIVGAAMRFMIS